MAKKIFEARNRHVPSCGKPPCIDSLDFRFASYFEGSCGDQWIVYWDDEKEELVLLGGDICWESPLSVKEAMSTLILGPPEQMWLVACRVAAQQMPKERHA